MGISLLRYAQRVESSVVWGSMHHTWILIGDGSHARLFHAGDPAQPWNLVQKLDREHSREKTDTAGSHQDGGEHGFARQLVAQLEAGRQAGSFDRLVLVASPKFLGQLRGELSGPLAACVVKSFDSDYTQMSEAELVKHVDIS